MARGRPLTDLTGHRYGHLTVIERVGTKNHRPTWRCLCDCGNEHTTTGANLRAAIKGTQSCGCLRTQMRIEQARRMREAKRQHPPTGNARRYGWLYS